MSATPWSNDGKEVSRLPAARAFPTLPSMSIRESARDLRRRLEAGGKASPFWIAGPCVIESRETLARIADTVAGIGARHGIGMVFKASFDKANRTSHRSPRGPGLEEGLRELRWVKERFGLPILTDVHEPAQVAAVAEVADVLQIPAFLCRQTDLLVAAAATGRLINVKKGQFLAPANVYSIVEKLRTFGAEGFWISERGVSFGYQRLVVDFAAFPEMEAAGAPLVLDITHSVQLPGAAGEVTGGLREAIPLIARAGAAVGVRGFFAETHPEPARSLSDAANAWPLSELEALVLRCRRVAAVHGETA